MSTQDENVALLYEELASQGVSAATVADGTVFMFSRAIVEDLYTRLQKDPSKQNIVLFLQRDREKLLATRTAERN